MGCSLVVPHAGVEPALLSELDFESIVLGTHANEINRLNLPHYT